MIYFHGIITQTRRYVTVCLPFIPVVDQVLPARYVDQVGGNQAIDQGAHALFTDMQGECQVAGGRQGATRPVGIGGRHE